MGKKFFGTDGIRGRTNVAPLTAEVALRVGQAMETHQTRLRDRYKDLERRNLPEAYRH